MPGKEHEVLPLIKKMFLMAFRLSGNLLKCREFLRGLGPSSYNGGLSNSTHLTLQSVLHLFSNHSAVKGEQISFHTHIIRRRQESGAGFSFNDS